MLVRYSVGHWALRLDLFLVLLWLLLVCYAAPWVGLDSWVKDGSPFWEPWGAGLLWACPHGAPAWIRWSISWILGVRDLGCSMLGWGVGSGVLVAPWTRGESSPLVRCYSTLQCWPALGGVGWGPVLWFLGDPGAVATATWPAAGGGAGRFCTGASQKAGILVKNWPYLAFWGLFPSLSCYASPHNPLGPLVGGFWQMWMECRAASLWSCPPPAPHHLTASQF